MTPALVRPDSWDFPLFLHLLGAFALVGGLFAASVLAVAAGRTQTSARLLTRLCFRALLFVVLPAFVVMRAGGQWIADREDVKGNPSWLGIGFAISDFGVVVLLALLVLGWLAARRTEDGRLSVLGRIVSVLAPLYLAALAVVWWAMTTKPGA